MLQRFREAFFLRRRFRFPQPVCSFGPVKYYSTVFSRRLAAIDSVAVAMDLCGILMRLNASGTLFIAASFHFFPKVTSSIMLTPVLSACGATTLKVGRIRLNSEPSTLPVPCPLCKCRSTWTENSPLPFY
jgi:hypothetical protein